jgi:acyl carrier protein
MNQEIYSKLITIVTPFVKDTEMLKNATAETSFLKDLKVSSSRLVDIVLDIEENFGIEVSDKEADSISTIGSAVELIASKVG